MKNILGLIKKHSWLRDTILGIAFVLLLIVIITVVSSKLNTYTLSFGMSFAIATMLVIGVTISLIFLGLFLNFILKKRGSKKMPTKPIETVKPIKQVKIVETAATVKTAKTAKTAKTKPASVKKTEPTTPRQKKTVKKKPKNEVPLLKTFINSTSGNPPIVRLYLDFDGTLTSKAGAELVTHPVYDKLTNHNGYQGLMENPECISENDILKNIDDLDGGETLFISLTEKAIKFLKNINRQGDKADIVIISKNHKTYIAAILKHHDLLTENIHICGITDMLDLKNKGDALKRIENEKQLKAKHIFIFDDDTKDANHLHQGALAAGYDAEHITMHIRQPGRFEWPNFRADIQEKISILDKIKE